MGDSARNLGDLLWRWWVKDRARGPFFSIFFDILPSLAALFAIGLCLRNVRELPWEGIFASVLASILSTIALANVIVSVISFWHRPYARGDLIRF